MQVIEAAKKRGQEKAKLTKSMIILDVKPWDDTTGTVPRQSLQDEVLGSKAMLHLVAGMAIYSYQTVLIKLHAFHILRSGLQT